jgi:hypothetical protein
MLRRVYFMHDDILYVVSSMCVKSEEHYTLVYDAV